ncbi:MAG: glucose-1-phosphate adenylyltransferase [Pseudomonadota bacterium]
MPTSSSGVLSVVLAGGEGKRLGPLTRKRAKPAIPFAGQYRLVDFVLSNLVHSHLLRIHVLTQYQSHSLIRHISHGWSFSAHLGQYCEVIPAHSGEGKGWYKGSADALYQNLRPMMSNHPKIVAVFGADHVYRMDVRQMINEHLESGADITVAVVPQPIETASRFGCITVDDQMRIVNFFEKPANPPPFPKDPSKSLISMGNYLFNLDVLREVIETDHSDPGSRNDIGGDILPKWVQRLNVHAYNFLDNKISGQTVEECGYWRDVGTIEAYWKASMDLVSVSPVFNLYNAEWPILTASTNYPPAKFVFADEAANRIGISTDSLVSNGCIISGGKIDRCVLGPAVRINSYSEVRNSVLFENCEIGRRCKIQNTIVEKGVFVPPDTRVGFDEEEDRSHGIHVDESGIRVVDQETELPK